MERSIACFDDFIGRYEGAEDSLVRTHLIAAYMKQALNYGLIGDFDQEIAIFEKILRDVDGFSDLEHIATGFNAWLLRDRRLAELGMAQEALEGCERLYQWVEKFPDIPSEEKERGLNWYSRCTHALARTHAGDITAALSSLKDACSAFNPKHDSAMTEIIRLTSELLAAGAEAEDLIAVLHNDEQRALDLLPLMVALQLHKGVNVNAPIEALEVAKDIQKSIEHRLENGLQPGYRLEPIRR